MTPKNKIAPDDGHFDCCCSGVIDLVLRCAAVCGLMTILPHPEKADQEPVTQAPGTTGSERTALCVGAPPPAYRAATTGTTAER